MNSDVHARYRRNGRPARLAIVVLAASALIGAAIAIDLGGSGALRGFLNGRSATKVQTAAHHQAAGGYSVRTETGTWTSLAPSEAEIVKRLSAGGIEIHSIDPMPEGSPTVPDTAMYRIGIAGGWSITEASPLTGSIDGITCSSAGQPTYEYRLVLNHVVLTLPGRGGIRFGMLGSAVVWTGDSAGWDNMVKSGVTELACPSTAS